MGTQKPSLQSNPFANFPNSFLSHSAPSPSRKSSIKDIIAFTLVELLVVIVIISLLMALVLPSLSQSMDLGRRIGCMNNLKQMGHAFMMYADDNDDWINPGIMLGPHYDTGVLLPRGWHERFSKLGVYSRGDYGLIYDPNNFGKSRSYICPSEKRKDFANPYHHYAGNYWIMGNASSGSYQWHHFGDLTADRGKVILIVDNNFTNAVCSSGYDDPTQIPPMDAYRHNKNSAINILYADGHVLCVSRKTIGSTVGNEMAVLMTVGK